MNSAFRTIRARLREMGPAQAERYVRSFDLHEDEARYIILRDARRKSIQQIADENSVSPETVKRRRRSGFRKMAEQATRRPL